MPIIQTIKQYLNIIIASVLIVLTFFFSALYYKHKINKLSNEYNVYKLTTEKNIEAQKASILAQENKLKEENIALIKKLKVVENENYKKYSKLQKDNANLKSSLADGSSSLFIHAKCPATANNQSGKAEVTNATGVDDGETSRVAIDSRDATAIIEITSKADKYKTQLESLQDWVNNLVIDNNK